MKRIIFVMPSFGAGGAEKSLLMLFNALNDEKDYSIDFLIFKKEGIFIEQIPTNVNVLEVEESLNILYSPISLSNFKKRKGFLISMTRIMANAISLAFSKNVRNRRQIRWKYYKNILNRLQGEYDYACGYLDGESIYYVVDKINAKYKYGWNQNDYNGLGMDKNIDLNYYEKLDGIITLTEECKSILIDNFPESESKILTIPPIVTKAFIQNSAKQFEPIEYKDKKGICIISVGRLVEQKGFDLAIEAAYELKQKGIQFTWNIIGAGELYDTLHRQVYKMGLEENVFLLGEKSNPYPYIFAADIFVQPSRYEGKSVILNEVKMLEKVIVATNYPTVYDQLEDRKNALISDMNAESLARCIIEVIEDSDLRESLICSLKDTDFEDASIRNEYLKLFSIGDK